MALEAGKKLSEGFSEYINIWTDINDFKQSANDHELSLQLLYKVLSGERPLTKSSIPLMYDLLRKAVSNRTKMLPKLNATHRKAKKLIEAEELSTT